MLNERKFLFVAWFRDESMPPSDQDYEWPACFFILADTENDALNWGDTLSKKYAVGSNQIFFRSYIDNYPYTGQDSELPIIKYGQLDVDEVIGW